MALSTPSLLTPVVTQLYATSISTASFTVGDGNTVFAIIYSRNTAQTHAVTSGLGLTWTQQFQTADGRLTVFSATGDASSTGVLTISKGGPSHLHVVGTDNASTTVVQEKEKPSGSGSNTVITLDATVGASNAVIGLLGATTGITITANDTSLGVSLLSSNSAATSEYATGAITNVSWTHVGATTTGYAFEVEEGVTDATAPILSLPTSTKTGSTTASGTVTTDEGNGTLYFLASTNASETAATIKTGSSQAVSATGSQAVSFTGLSPSTTYYAHYVHDDAANNESNVQSSASFTTDAAGGTIAPMRRRMMMGQQ